MDGIYTLAYICREQLKIKTMKNFKAVITDTTAPNNGQIIANTKSPSKYKGMTKKQFVEATENKCIYTIEIIEM